MAKGNMLLGYSRGSVGDVTFSRLKGQQVARARNRKPANPQTNKQMYQRALFADVVKFFTRGNKNFYRFAFESKKASESDYNAFMRENVKRGVVISPAAFALYGYPALGNFIMAKGSLQPTVNRVVNDYWQTHFGVAVPESMPTTVGGLSSLLIATGQYMAGDILTFVYITTTYSGSLPSVSPEGEPVTTWDIEQFILDESDSTTLSTFGMRAVSRTWDDTAYLTLTDLEDSQKLGSAYSGFVCVHSRNATTGTKVSTQELMLGESAVEAIEDARQSAYINAVIAAWKTTDVTAVRSEAILQGSLAPEPITIATYFGAATYVVEDDADEQIDVMPGSSRAGSAAPLAIDMIVNPSTKTCDFFKVPYVGESYDAEKLNITGATGINASAYYENGILTYALNMGSTSFEEGEQYDIAVTYDGILLASIKITVDSIRNFFGRITEIVEAEEGVTVGEATSAVGDLAPATVVVTAAQTVTNLDLVTVQYDSEESFDQSLLTIEDGGGIIYAVYEDGAVTVSYSNNTPAAGTTNAKVLYNNMTLATVTLQVP